MSIIWGKNTPDDHYRAAEKRYSIGCHITPDTDETDVDFMLDRFSFECPLVTAAERSGRYPHRPSFGEWLAKMAATVLIGFVVIATPVALYLLFRAGDSPAAAIESDRARKQAAGILAEPVVVRSLSPVYDADAPSSAAVRCFETGFGEDGTDYLAGGTGR